MIVESSESGVGLMWSWKRGSLGMLAIEKAHFLSGSINSRYCPALKGGTERGGFKSNCLTSALR